jgi:hypothetical protein
LSDPVTDIINLISEHPVEGIAVGAVTVAAGLGFYSLKRKDDGKPVSMATLVVLAVAAIVATVSIFLLIAGRPKKPDEGDGVRSSQPPVSDSSSQPAINPVSAAPTSSSKPAPPAPKPVLYDPEVDRRFINEQFEHYGHFQQLNGGFTTVSAVSISDRQISVKTTLYANPSNPQVLTEFVGALSDIDQVLDAVPGIGGGGDTVITFKCISGKCLSRPPSSLAASSQFDLNNYASAHLSREADVLSVRRAFARLVSTDHSDIVLCKLVSMGTGPKCS